jgi:23S rRNA (uracil1939-C5)-methyltransferase
MNAYLAMKVTKMMKMMNKSEEQRSFLFQKNQELTLTAVDMNHQGYGVAKVDGFVVFVKGMIVEETARVKIVKIFKNYAYAILLELLTESEHRVKPVCSVYQTCGGCDLMHVSADFQKTIKYRIVAEQFTRQGLETDVISQTMAMETPLQYRNKVILPVAYAKGRVKIGFYRQNSHDIVEFDTCHVQSTLQNEIISKLKQTLDENPIYELKNVVIRESYSNHDIMIGLVVSNVDNPQLSKLTYELVKSFSEIKSIILNLNDQKTNTIFGKKDKVLYGESFLLDECLGLKFKISLRSFYQVNSEMMSVLYEQTLLAANIQRHEVVLDLYCGIGTIALLASQYAKKVYGVEQNPQAIVDAKRNAKLNDVYNSEFMCGDAKDIVDHFVKHNIKLDTIIVDPPRAGLHDHVIDIIKSSGAQKLVYVSCNPLTLAANLKSLSDIFTVESVQPVDMFGQTKHVETVVLLSRKG